MCFRKIQLNVKWEKRTSIEMAVCYLSGEGGMRGSLLGQLFR